MKSHPEEAVLAAWSLDEIDEGERPRVAEHLETCASCRERVARLSVALATWREEPEADAPPAILVDLLRAQAGARPTETRTRGVRAALAIAATLLLFLGGFWTGRMTVGEFESAAPAGESRTAGAFADSSGVREVPEPPLIRFVTLSERPT